MFNIRVYSQKHVELAKKKTQPCFAFCVPYVCFYCCISASPLSQRIQSHPYEDIEQTE